MSGTDLPPTYTQEPSESDAPLSSDSSDISFVSAPSIRGDATGPYGANAAGTELGPQIIIVPAANGVHFQKGFLGADGERAAIEGELQIKSADASFRWRKVTVSLRTVEEAHGHEIELALTDVELASSPDPEGHQRSSFPFSIPLPSDTPQCLHTSRSSLTHTLSVSIWPLDDDAPPLWRAFAVHTRRYTTHTHVLYPVPETRVLEEPSRVEVQVPRTTFKAGEAIPIYVTVPTPSPDLILEQGIRLRNLRAELVRNIHIKKPEGDDVGPGESASAGSSESEAPPVSPQKMTAGPSSSREGIDFISRHGEHGERKVIALSGASCRLHPSQPLRVRLVLRPPSQSPFPDTPNQLSTEDLFSFDPDADCGTITQSTLLHSVSFRLLVHATFMNMAHHTERVSTVSIPLHILPANAPLPEVESSIDEAYHKKHDRPPTRTVRQDDAEVPQYEAGPSAIAGAPPPFEEREAPPPFWSTEAEAEASTSTRLPTFLESEHEIYVPSDEDPALAPPPPPPPAPGEAGVQFEGEGTLFGFLPSAQFDGYADVLTQQGGHPPRAFTPPPTLEMATRDTDVTGLANMDEGAALEALGLALEQDAAAAAGVGAEDEHLLPPPPPPPPMDDPSDPPPSIDSSDFRAPGAAHPHDSPPALPARAQSPHTSFGQLTEQPVHGVLPPHDDEGESHGHAPPPYRVPDMESDHERVTHPPPYMDLVHGPR
ncbi:hypothetical protein C2E23DRAFT_746739 [Lenzites betulinus]|nr:hypothetical protein C2E23DRAFT_746739 [Lenzites betulinus]